MRVEISDNQRTRSIDTDDPAMIGEWMARQARQNIGVNWAMPPLELRVFPSYPDEYDIGMMRLESMFDREGVLKLIGKLSEIAVLMEARDGRRA